MLRVASITAIVVLISAACGSGDSGGSSADGGQDGDGMAMEDTNFEFGRPGDEAKVDRTIEVLAQDSLRFEPQSLEVSEGETIKFVITNEGDDLHEFVLGDPDYQEEHAQEMEGDHAMASGPNQVELEAGATQEIIWTFSGAEEVLYACHEPGHYEGGMIGTISVEN
jgi:uncharacterized cupredoxin-like copper-binding protein